MAISVGLFFIPDRYKQKLDRTSHQDMKLQRRKQGELIFT